MTSDSGELGETFMQVFRATARFTAFSCLSTALVHPFDVFTVLRQSQFIPIYDRPDGELESLQKSSITPWMIMTHSELDSLTIVEDEKKRLEKQLKAPRLAAAEKYVASISRSQSPILTKALDTRPQDPAEATGQTDSLGYLTLEPEIAEANLSVVLPSRIPLDVVPEHELTYNLHKISEPSTEESDKQYDDVLMLLDLNTLPFLAFLKRFVRTQGLFSLRKGLWIGCWHHMLKTLLTWILQFKLEGYLMRTIPPVYFSDIQCTAISALTSHIFIGVLLSPLELLRTRLIVQSSLPVEQKYRHGILSNLRLIAREEGGIWPGLYSRHFYLTLAYYASLPILHHLPDLLFDCTQMHVQGNIDGSDDVIIQENVPEYSLLHLALAWIGRALHLCISLPIEICRKRKFLYPRILQEHKATNVDDGDSRNNGFKPKRIFPFITCIRIRPMMMMQAQRSKDKDTDAVDENMYRSMYRIYSEEGIGTLYKGWTLKLSSAGIHLALNLAQYWTLEDEDYGTQEPGLWDNYDGHVSEGLDMVPLDQSQDAV
jgi:hypothetical protein